MEEIQIGSKSVFTGTVDMAIPAGYNRSMFRVAEIRLPHLFETKPTVNLTLYGTEGSDILRYTFVVYNITLNEQGAETQIAIEASNTNKAEPCSLHIFCDYIVIGKIRD